MFQNADTSGARPLKYSFDVATDAAFKNIVFARTGVEPGSDGVTRFQLPDKLAAGTYWWRTRAEDGANTGPYSAVEELSSARGGRPGAADTIVSDRTARLFRT